MSLDTSSLEMGPNVTQLTSLESIVIETKDGYFRSYLSIAAFTIIAAFLVPRYISYLLSERPPWRSGLKPLPGPLSTVPYLGRVHDVDPKYVFIAMKKFSQKYNGLFSMTLGGETHIWIGRTDVAFDLLCKNAAISSGRNDLGAYPHVTKKTTYIPLMDYNDSLVRQRRFAHTMMSRNVNDKFLGYVTLEAKWFLHELLRDPKNYHDLSYLTPARISARLGYGSPESANAHKSNALHFIRTISPSGPIMNLIPFLGYLPEWLMPSKREVRLRQENESRIWHTNFRKAEKAYNPEERPINYVTAYLDSMRNATPGRSKFEDEIEAINAIGMLVTVAIITIGGPITLFIMCMILHPEWQEKIRKEIDEVVGDGMVELGHSPQLPMLRAAIKEGLRWKPTVPLGVPRALDENYSFDGYHFPKGAIVHVLDVALASDPVRYPDPDTYNPDRWLNEKYPTFQGPLTDYPRLKGHHIFGSGRRICPGPDLVEAESLVLCGNLLKFFNLKPAVGKDGQPIWPDPKRWSYDVIGGPLPFECDIQVRDAEKARIIKENYEEAF